jgi:hypothetical protein
MSYHAEEKGRDYGIERERKRKTAKFQLKFLEVEMLFRL